MKLWHLKNREAGSWPEDMKELIVRAEHMWEARRVAADGCRDEGARLWLVYKRSSCTILKVKGKEGIIIEQLRGY